MGKGKNKVGIQGAKPEPPPFLQRAREQMIAMENAAREAEGNKKRKALAERADDSDDDPVMVNAEQSELTEEEYKKIKRDLETKYKLDDEASRSNKIEELNIDSLIESRQSDDQLGKAAVDDKDVRRRKEDDDRPGKSKTSETDRKKTERAKKSKLSFYDDDSDEDSSD